MIRYTLLWLFVCVVLVYSWKDWYRGLCATIVMLGVIEHPDMPKGILGIPGLNPWNLLLFNVMLAWICQRHREGLRWDLPRHVGMLLVLCLGVVLFGFARIFDNTVPPEWETYTFLPSSVIFGEVSVLEWYYNLGTMGMVNDFLVNAMKWVIPGLLLYDGCRTEERFRLAVISILCVYVLLAVQVVKWMPPYLALDPDMLEDQGNRLARRLGHSRVNLSAMLAGAVWAILATRVLIPRGIRWLVPAVTLFVIYAQLMTGGRAGYGTCLAVGLAMSVFKWRRYLIAVPAVGLVLLLLAPGIVGRAFEGFTSESRDTNQRLETLMDRGELQRQDGPVDLYTVTAGRSIAWPIVIERIKERPWIGHGREAMIRSGTALAIYDDYREAFPHPHNAYLQLLFDNGIIGAVPILTFYALALFYSMRMFVDKHSPSVSAIGGVSTALLLSLMVSAIGSQSFYPDEGWVSMWCALFLMLRVRVERRRVMMAGAPATVEAGTSVAATSGAGPMTPRARWVSMTALEATRPPVTKRPAPRMPVPRASSPRAETSPVSVALRAPVRSAATREMPATRARRSATPFRTASPPVPSGAISPLGLFGRAVSDSTVWERA